MYLTGTEGKRLSAKHGEDASTSLVGVKCCNADVTELFLVGFEHLYPNNPPSCSTTCVFLNDFFFAIKIRSIPVDGLRQSCY